MGDTELADVLWRFSRQHLRLALLAADIYNRMMTVSEQGTPLCVFHDCVCSPPPSCCVPLAHG